MKTWVLLVSREGPRQRWLRDALERAGLEVESAPSVDAAVASLAVMRPSMVAIDAELTDEERDRILAILTAELSRSSPG